MDKIAGEYLPIGRVTFNRNMAIPVYPTSELAKTINNLEERIVELEEQLSLLEERVTWTEND